MRPLRLVYINTSLKPQDYNPQIAKTCLRFRPRIRIRLMQRGAICRHAVAVGWALPTKNQRSAQPAGLCKPVGSAPPYTKEGRWWAMAASHGSRLRAEARGTGGRLAARQLIAQLGGQFILLGGDRVGQLLVERAAHLVVRTERFLQLDQARD